MIGNLATCAYYFGWIAGIATLDLAASSALTCEQLGWNPTGPDLLTDPREMDYSYPTLDRFVDGFCAVPHTRGLGLMNVRRAPYSRLTVGAEQV
jgi:hypothetical protein